MRLQFKTDEFGILLIGALIFFLGLTAINYFLKLSELETRVDNKTIFFSNFLLDGMEKRVSLFEGKEKIYKNFFTEKNFYIKVDIPKEEIEFINKLIVDFESKKEISRLYLFEKKMLFPSKREYLKNEIKPRMEFIAKIEEYDPLIPNTILFLAFSLAISSYIIYIKYHKYRDKIVITSILVISILLAIFFSIGNIRITDEVELKIYTLKNYAEKTFFFFHKPGYSRINISFEIGKSIRTGNLKIFLNDKLIYNEKPITNSILIILPEIKLENKNSLRFEISEGLYEIRNLYLTIF